MENVKALQTHHVHARRQTLKCTYPDIKFISQTNRDSKVCKIVAGQYPLKTFSLFLTRASNRIASHRIFKEQK